MLSKIKLEIEKKLFYNDILFKTKSYKFENKTQIYFITNNYVGIVIYVDGKVKYYIADNQKINWAIEEGFSEEQINDEFCVFDVARTLDSFVNKLSNKKKVTKGRKRIKFS
jgi:hypothetical protein